MSAICLASQTFRSVCDSTMLSPVVTHGMIDADKEHVEREAGTASSKMPYLVQVNAGVSLHL